MLNACQKYIAGEFLTLLTERLSATLSPSGWKLEVSHTDPNTVEFEYPAALDSVLEYIKPRVVLELGTHAEPIPHEERPIHPFAAEQFPNLFKEPSCQVTTVVARRTFWEKATILHVEYHRPLKKPMLPRYSRHYADVATMGQAHVKDEALGDLDLLKNVAIHKDYFYHCGWARYLDATPGSFHLLPRDERLATLHTDYRAMQTMFFSEPPNFDNIIEQLAYLEQQINQ